MRSLLDPARRAYIHPGRRRRRLLSLVTVIRQPGPADPAAVVAVFDLLVALAHREVADWPGKVSAAVYALALAAQPIGVAVAFGTDAQWAIGLQLLSAILGGGLCGRPRTNPAARPSSVRSSTPTDTATEPRLMLGIKRGRWQPLLPPVWRSATMLTLPLTPIAVGGDYLTGKPGGGSVRSNRPCRCPCGAGCSSPRAAHHHRVRRAVATRHHRRAAHQRRTHGRTRRRHRRPVTQRRRRWGAMALAVPGGRVRVLVCGDRLLGPGRDDGACMDSG